MRRRVPVVLTIAFRDGPALTFMTDGNWRWTARPEEGWERPEYDDQTWLPVETWSWKGTGISPWNLFDGLSKMMATGFRR
jgi:hypothetical protein